MILKGSDSTDEKPSPRPPGPANRSTMGIWSEMGRCGSIGNFYLTYKHLGRTRIPGKMDIVDVAKRSEMMAGIKSKNTRPELIVRKFLHSQGFRFRLHSRKLPGSPDLVLPRFKVAILVHGCFWHRHHNCRYATNPSSNIDRWNIKFEANVARDDRNRNALMKLGWTVIIVWECELRGDPQRRLEQLVCQIHDAVEYRTPLRCS